MNKQLWAGIKETFKLLVTSAGLGWLFVAAGIVYMNATGGWVEHSPQRIGVMVLAPIALGLAIQLVYWLPFMLVDLFKSKKPSIDK